MIAVGARMRPAYGSGITFDAALERAGVPTDRHRWVVRTQLPTEQAGPFGGNLIATMRWLTPEQAIIATQVTARFPFNHGAPIHIGDPAAIGCTQASEILYTPGVALVGPLPEPFALTTDYRAAVAVAVAVASDRASAAREFCATLGGSQWRALRQRSGFLAE